MSLSKGKLNPLTLLNQRKLTFIPEHFTKIKVNRNVNIKLIEQWINYNLNSRYAIKISYIFDEKNKLCEIYEIALEEPKELTLLSLGCTHLHKKKEI